MKKRSILRWVLFWVSLAVLVFSLVNIGIFFWQAHVAKKVQSQTVKTYVQKGGAELPPSIPSSEPSGDPTTPTTPAESMPDVPELRDRIDFSGLKEVNRDVAAWVAIPALPATSFPVIWCGDDETYLHKGWEGDYNWYGSIFLEGMNNPDFGDLHAIIYGHNMLDGTMFGTLEAFKEEEFYRQNSPYVIIYTPNHVMLYEIFSVEYTEGTDEDVYNVVFADDAEYAAFVAELKSRSLYDTGVEVSEEDQVLTVSTCAYIFDDARFVLHAKQVWVR